MDGNIGGSLQRAVVARYFEMWNTGDSSIALEILSPGWVDHAHPEVAGPEGVRQSVDAVRAAQPELRFHITALLGDGDLISAVGGVGRGASAEATTSQLIWLIRLEGRQLAEMWTYRRTTA